MAVILQEQEINKAWSFINKSGTLLIDLDNLIGFIVWDKKSRENSINSNPSWEKNDQSYDLSESTCPTEDE